MNNEYLEALSKNIRYKKEYVGNDTYRLYIKKNDIELLEKEIQRLEQIDNAGSSEAMECLLDIKSNYKFYTHNNRAIDYQCSVITQSLLKTQKLEKENAELKKVLEIIKEKNLFEPTHKYIFDYTKVYATYSHMFRAYKLDEANKLTAEEYVLLKECLE